MSGKWESGADMLAAEAAFAQVFEASGDAMKLIDLDGRIVRWNRAATELHGWTEPEVIGRVLPHVHPDTHVRTIRDIRTVAASGQSAMREAVMLCKDGSRKSVAVTVIPYLDADGNPAGVVSLCTELRGAGGERSLDDLSVALADALRAPLTAVVGYAQLLLQPGILEDGTRRRRTVRAIEEQVATVTELLSDVSLVAEARSGVPDADSEDVELGSAVTDAVRRAERMRSGRRFVIDLEPLPGPVRIGRYRLERALANLIVLAADGTSEGDNVFVTVGKRGRNAAVLIEAQPEAVSSHTRDDFAVAADLSWHTARIVAEVYGGTTSRTTRRDGVVTYRMILPMSARADER